MRNTTFIVATIIISLLWIQHVKGLENPCSYCKFCKFCSQCSSCPCNDKKHCDMCKYCQYCSYCSLCTVCDKGGEQLLNAMGSGLDAVQSGVDYVKGWWSGDAQEEPKKDKLQLDPETERQLKEDLKKLKTEL